MLRTNGIKFGKNNTGLKPKTENSFEFVVNNTKIQEINITKAPIVGLPNTKIEYKTQQEYDLLSIKDPNTIYLIKIQ